jgi:O-succinylbenzoate synthase
MKLKEINLYRYSIPLKKTINIKGYLQRERNGTIIEIVDEKNNKGYGEASPFPGLHSESVEKIIQQFKNLKSVLFNIDPGHFTIFSLDLPPCSNCLQFGIEWAIINLKARQRNENPAYVLNSNYLKTIRINPLLTGNYEEILAYALTLKMENPRAVKLKVGFRPLEDDIYLTKKLDEIFENKIPLRLDANRNWSLNQAVTFGHGVYGSNIEYIEEPLQNPLQLTEFYEKTGMEYALDETLSANTADHFESFKGISAFIIKPSVIGSLRKIKNLLDIADINKYTCIFSSTFESGVGLWAAAAMACAFSAPNSVHGLDTYKWLKNDIIEPPFSPEKFMVNPDHGYPFSIKPGLLTRVT